MIFSKRFSLISCYCYTFSQHNSFQDYDHERTSVSDEKNKAFLKFLHTLDRCDTDLDEHVQPGGDLTSYLRDLKSSAR